MEGPSGNSKPNQRQGGGGGGGRRGGRGGGGRGGRSGQGGQGGEKKKESKAGSKYGGGVPVDDGDRPEREHRPKQKVRNTTEPRLGDQPSQRLREERRGDGEEPSQPSGPPFTAFVAEVSRSKEKEFVTFMGTALAAERQGDIRWRGDGGFFLDFKSERGLMAMLALGGNNFDGRRLRIEIAKAKLRDGGGGGGKGRGGGRRRERAKFAEYLEPSEVEKLLAEGSLCQAALRVNPHNRREGYATVPGFDHDVKFRDLSSQNRAFDGDWVAIRINAPEDWIKMDTDEAVAEKETNSQDSAAEETEDPAAADLAKSLSELQLQKKEAAAGGLRPTGTVVAIVKPASDHPTFVGWLRGSSGHDDDEIKDDAKFAHFIPFSKKMHRVLVPLERLPRSWRRATSYKTHLYACEVTSWKIDASSPFGKLVKDYGEGGNLEVEKTILLEANNIDYDDSFSPAVNACLPEKGYVISPEEVALRRDLRKTTLICSIDPATARDLDDALSIDRLPNGNFEVGGT